MYSLRNIFKIFYYTYLLFLFFIYSIDINDQTLEFYKYEEQNIFLKNIDHFILFFILGAVSMLINNNQNIYDKYIILTIIISILIEFIHYFLPYRGFELIDFILNITGCILGIISLYYLRKKLWKNY